MSNEESLAAKPLGIILPFLGMMLGPKSALERALAADAPELLMKVRKLTNGYFRNLAPRPDFTPFSGLVERKNI